MVFRKRIKRVFPVNKKGRKQSGALPSLGLGYS